MNVHLLSRLIGPLILVMLSTPGCESGPSKAVSKAKPAAGPKPPSVAPWKTIGPFDHAITDVMFSPSGGYFGLALLNGGVKIHGRTVDWKSVWSWEGGHDVTAADIAFSADDKYAVIGGFADEKDIAIVGLPPGGKPRSLKVDYRLGGLAVSPDDRFLFAFGNYAGRYDIWEFDKMPPVHLQQASADINYGATAFGPSDPGYLAIDLNGSIKLHNFEKGRFAEASAIQTGNDKRNLTLAFNPDGTVLAGSGTNGNRVLRVWKISEASRGAIAQVPAPDADEGRVCSYFSDLEFTPDGAHLVACCGQRVGIWRWTGTALKERAWIELPGARANKLTISSDGKLLAVAEQAGRAVHIWKLQDLLTR